MLIKLILFILGEAICDLTNAIISEWGIPLNKLQFIITDNGSNMVKAYKLGEVAAFDMDRRLVVMRLKKKRCCYQRRTHYMRRNLMKKK